MSSNLVRTAVAAILVFALIAPIYVLGLARADTPGVKHDAEGTGLGWKVEALIEARDTAPPDKVRNATAADVTSSLSNSAAPISRDKFLLVTEH